MRKIFLVFLLFSTLFTACYKDKLSELYVGADLFTPCDTVSTVSYSNHILPLMENYCFSCHSGTAPSSSFRIDTHASLQQYALTNNELLGHLEGSGGWSQMPQNFQLNQCQIRQFEIWIADGALNN